MIPLPQIYREAINKNPQANFGLRFNKWINFRGTFENPEELKDDKINVLKELIKGFENQETQLKQECKRKLDRISSLLISLKEVGYNATILKCKVNDVLISGMGNEHVLENSINLDRCTGLPYIPASSIKGVASYAARFDEEQNKAIQGNPDGIFGSQTKMGEVIFFDGFPLEVPTLKLDIMNNHYPKYYSNPEKEFPSDDQDPNPVTFLVVNEGAEFYFPIAAKDNNKLEKAVEFLKSALSKWGVGAKTAVGYGIFRDFGEVSSRKLVPVSELKKNFEDFRLSPSPENFKRFIEKIKPEEINELKVLSFGNVRESINIGFVTPLAESDIPAEIKRVLASKLLEVIEKGKKWKEDKLAKYEKLQKIAGKN